MCLIILKLILTDFMYFYVIVNYWFIFCNLFLCHFRFMFYLINNSFFITFYGKCFNKVIESNGFSLNCSILNKSIDDIFLQIRDFLVFFLYCLSGFFFLLVKSSLDLRDDAFYKIHDLFNFLIVFVFVFFTTITIYLFFFLKNRKLISVYEIQISWLFMKKEFMVVSSL